MYTISKRKQCWECYYEIMLILPVVQANKAAIRAICSGDRSLVLVEWGSCVYLPLAVSGLTLPTSVYNPLLFAFFLWLCAIPLHYLTVMYGTVLIEVILSADNRIQSRQSIAYNCAYKKCRLCIRRAQACSPTACMHISCIKMRNNRSKRSSFKF